GVCHRDISLENILMDTSSVSKRACATRSCSVSSVGSSITISSDDTEHEDRFEEAGGGRGSPGSYSPRSYSPPCSPQGCGSGTAERRKTTDVEGEWFGTPRLCDFGMSVRIPTSPATGTACLRLPCVL
ncbi:unnamed protein product, partial [Ectocarpus fasciculatus]